jgi:hypothetical protein
MYAMWVFLSTLSLYLFWRASRSGAGHWWIAFEETIGDQAGIANRPELSFTPAPEDAGLMQYQRLGPQLQKARTGAELQGIRDQSAVPQHLTRAAMTALVRASVFAALRRAGMGPFEQDVNGLVLHEMEKKMADPIPCPPAHCS